MCTSTKAYTPYLKAKAECITSSKIDGNLIYVMGIITLRHTAALNYTTIYGYFCRLITAIILKYKYQMPYCNPFHNMLHQLHSSPTPSSTIRKRILNMSLHLVLHRDRCWRLELGSKTALKMRSELRLEMELE
jgi:hypothetical protein